MMTSDRKAAYFPEDCWLSDSLYMTPPDSAAEFPEKLEDWMRAVALSVSSRKPPSASELQSTTVQLGAIRQGRGEREREREKDGTRSQHTTRYVCLCVNERK